MHAWKSISRCVSQAGNVPTSLCRSTATFHSRYYTTGADPSPSTSRGKHTGVVDASRTPEQKEPSLSETLRKLNNGNDSRKKSKEEPRRPEYSSLMKSPPKQKKVLKRTRVKKEKKTIKDKRPHPKANGIGSKLKGRVVNPIPYMDPGLGITTPLKQALGKLPQPQDFPSTSILSTETWDENTWKSNNVLDDNPHEDRSAPPHILKQEVARSGVLLSENATLVDVAAIAEQQPVDELAHGLDRVLFNPGVHWLQDPRSRVYNFTPWLQKIPKVNDFAFERLSGFIKSSRDEELRELAKREGKAFAGSTSSLSGMLCHIYFLLSEYKDVDYSSLSQHFKNQPSNFTSGQRMPAAVKLNYKDGVYAIDSHSVEYDDPDKNVLTWLGTLLENFLTKNAEEFNKFMKFQSSPEQPEVRLKPAYRYAKSKKFVMRSQLDCHDKRLPGTGIFDIKTRACITVRMDILNYLENAGYLIQNQTGILESFEREYYDLVRSGFLKYSFQARIGNMDGVMVTYHNTERIFGFQYISLAEMDERLFGPTPGLGDKVFNYCVSLLEDILEEACAFYPQRSVICYFETRMPGKVLEVYVQPADWNGPTEEVPIKKLVVTLDHQSGGLPTRAVTAMRQPDHWSVSYQIGRQTLSDEDIRRDYAGMEVRKRRLLVLPSNISDMEEAKEFWNGLNFSNTGNAGAAKIFHPDSFTLATASVEVYRELSRKGRLLSQQIEEEEKGRPKIVHGLGIYEGGFADEGRSGDVGGAPLNRDGEPLRASSGNRSDTGKETVVLDDRVAEIASEDTKDPSFLAEQQSPAGAPSIRSAGLVAETDGAGNDTTYRT